MYPPRLGAQIKRWNLHEFPHGKRRLQAAHQPLLMCIYMLLTFVQSKGIFLFGVFRDAANYTYNGKASRNPAIPENLLERTLPNCFVPPF